MLRRDRCERTIWNCASRWWRVSPSRITGRGLAHHRIVHRSSPVPGSRRTATPHTRRPDAAKFTFGRAGEQAGRATGNSRARVSVNGSEAGCVLVARRVSDAGAPGFRVGEVENHAVGRATRWIIPVSRSVTKIWWFTRLKAMFPSAAPVFLRPFSVRSANTPADNYSPRRGGKWCRGRRPAPTYRTSFGSCRARGGARMLTFAEVDVGRADIVEHDPKTCPTCPAVTGFLCGSVIQ